MERYEFYRTAIIENNEYDEEESYRDYISTFAAMARKGFVSYDRVNAFDIADNRYSWVARPCDFPKSSKPDIELPLKRTSILEVFTLILKNDEVDFIDLLR